MTSATLHRRCLKLLARARAQGAADLIALASVAATSLAAGATLAFAWFA
jgi:hypothetical protein